MHADLKGYVREDYIFYCNEVAGKLQQVVLGKANNWLIWLWCVKVSLPILTSHQLSYL